MEKLEEEFDILDENGNKINEIRTSNDVHKFGLWHRAIEVVLIDDDGNILIQQRNSNKAFFADMWDMAVSGHVSAGELSTDAAIRELGEELGLKYKKEDLKFISSFRELVIGETKTEKLFFDIFYIKGKINISNIRLQESEVQDFRLASVEEIKELVQNKVMVVRGETLFLIDLIEKGILC